MSEPPPLVPPTALSPNAPGVPSSIRTATTAAQEGGWRWDLHRWARGSDGQHFVALRAAKPGRRVAMVWTYVAAHWTAGTKRYEPRQVEARWENDGAWVRSPTQASVTHTDAVKELRRG